MFGSSTRSDMVFRVEHLQRAARRPRLARLSASSRSFRPEPGDRGEGQGLDELPDGESEIVHDAGLQSDSASLRNAPGGSRLVPHCSRRSQSKVSARRSTSRYSLHISSICLHVVRRACHGLLFDEKICFPVSRVARCQNRISNIHWRIGLHQRHRHVGRVPCQPHLRGLERGELLGGTRNTFDGIKNVLTAKCRSRRGWSEFSALPGQSCSSCAVSVAAGRAAGKLTACSYPCIYERAPARPFAAWRQASSRLSL